MTEQDKLDILARLDRLPERDAALMWKIITNLIDTLIEFPLPTKAEGAKHES